jgi:NitT/TauT family transport system permease protein
MSRMVPRITNTRISGVLDPLIFLVGVIVLWQVAVSLKLVDNLVLPAPGDVVVSFFELFAAGRIWTDIWVTTWETLAGFVIAAIGGVVLAVVTGLSKRMKSMLYPHIIALQVMPRIAIAPILIAWLGFGDSPKIAIAALIAFFPVFVNTLTGMASIGSEEEEMFRSLGATKRQLFVNLMLPTSLPLIFAGLKTAMTLALTGAIVAEFISAEYGLGLLVQRYSYQLNMDDAFAVLIVLMLLGLLLYAVTAVLDSVIVFWNHDTRLNAKTRAKIRRDPAWPPAGIDSASKASHSVAP